MIKVLVVDDSAFMRIALVKMLELDPKIKVVATAEDGAAALEMALIHHPQVITMDVEMPNMDGIKAVRTIMAQAPCPIIMLSRLTDKGAKVTLEALNEGAVDFIAKNSSMVNMDMASIEAEVLDKVRYWAANGMLVDKKASLKPQRAPEAVRSTKQLREVEIPNNIDLIVIGVSTGGPTAVLNLLGQLEPLDIPIVIAQHMPKEFTPSYAQSLNAKTKHKVVEGREGMAVKKGEVIVLPGGTDGQLFGSFLADVSLSLRTSSTANIHPNADVLFRSALQVAKNPVGLILTGMGSDGTEGAKLFAEKKLPIVVQEPSGCVVDGMVLAALESGAVTHIMPLNRMAKRLTQWCR